MLRLLILLLILFAPSCAEAMYRFCPDPGHWNATKTQYENHVGRHGAGVLYINGKVYDVSGYDRPINPKEAAYLENITWHKGKIDRNECAVIALKLGTGLFDAIASAGAISRGCEEIGSFGLLGKSPSLPAYVGFQLVMAAPFVYVAHKTPLAYSSAPYLLLPATYFAVGSIKASRHALGCLR
jgi:hypothetical protein